MGQYLYCGGNKKAEIALTSLSERCMDFRDHSSVAWTSHKYNFSLTFHMQNYTVIQVKMSLRQASFKAWLKS